MISVEMKPRSLVSIVRLLTMFVGFTLLAGLGCPSTNTMPSNAEVFVEDDAKTYFAPPCLEQDRPSLRATTADRVHSLKYRPDPKCRDEGGFTQDGRSVTGILFEALGVLPPLPSRWNSDGTWNW